MHFAIASLIAMLSATRGDWTFKSKVEKLRGMLPSMMFHPRPAILPVAFQAASVLHFTLSSLVLVGTRVLFCSCVFACPFCHSLVLAIALVRISSGFEVLLLNKRLLRAIQSDQRIQEGRFPVISPVGVSR